MLKHEEKLLIENILYNSIRTFYDLDDVQKRNQIVKEYFFQFCDKYNMNYEEVLSKLMSMFSGQMNKKIYQDCQQLEKNLGLTKSNNKKTTK